MANHDESRHFMKQIAFGFKYILNHQVFKKNTPLICGLTVTNRCNLSCRHCRVARRGAKNSTFPELTAAIDSFYQQGGRTLYLQGGEPFLWRDQNYDLEDIVKYAREAGYLATVIYTNGTFPIKASADTVFISLDGLAKTNDFLRGVTFDKIMTNIYESRHPSLYINFTINNYNKNELRDFCEFMNKVERIKGTFFYFHTPYYGYDELYIEPDERNRILRELIEYKKKYKILNSRAGLLSALRNDWRRPLDICYIYEKGDIYKCCRTPGDPELCLNCGYLSYAEIDQTLKLKPSAIFNALRYF